MMQTLFGRLGLAGGAFLLALALPACGGSSKSSSSTVTTVSPANSTVAGDSGVTTTVVGGVSTPTSTGGGAKSGHLGDTLSVTDLGGDTATVTFVRMIDPATSTSSANVADAGNRWVGFEATIVDSGDNAGNDSNGAAATGSDGKTYTSNSDISGQVVGCTQNTDGSKANQKATFCPGFLVPTGVKLTQVGYSVAGSDVGAAPTLTWSIP